VTVTVVEKNMLGLKAETFVTSTGSEGGVETTATLNNAFGYTEKISAAGSYGTAAATAARVELLKPKLFGWPFSLTMGASNTTATRAMYSSYDEKTQEVRADLRHLGGRHELGVGSAWRDVLPSRSKANEFDFAASGLIIAQAKPSLKNSVHYTFTADRRDDPHGPSQGSLLRTRAELAGFGGDTHFVKAQVAVQQFARILKTSIPDCAVGLSFNAGALCPLSALAGSSSGGGSGAAKAGADGGKSVGGSSSISDRFWLGGPMTLRGFNFKGAGPRTSPKRQGAEGGDSLGGDVFWSVGASLYLPFPHKLLHAAGMRGHLYANAGNLCAWETSARTLLLGARASVGAGLVFPTLIGRIEANYSYVLRANSRDQVRRFQMGLGMDFL
jgi:outer membrane protein insertion porin family